MYKVCDKRSYLQRSQASKEVYSPLSLKSLNPGSSVSFIRPTSDYYRGEEVIRLIPKLPSSPLISEVRSTAKISVGNAQGVEQIRDNKSCNHDLLMCKYRSGIQ
jgi:hypothetical protein